MSLRSISLIAALASCLLVTPGLATTYKTPDGTLSLSARKVEIFGDKLIAAGKAHVRRVDSKTKSTLNADAEKIVVKIGAAPSAKTPKAATSGTSVQSAELTGPVKMVYSTFDANGIKVVTTACADSASFDGAANLAYLVGNVKITNENPVLFALPAVMTGDKATVNLNPNPGPEEFRFRVESSPGTSDITVTPQTKENQ